MFSMDLGTVLLLPKPEFLFNPFMKRIILLVGSLSVYHRKPYLFLCSVSCWISLIFSAVTQTQRICTMLKKRKLQYTYWNLAAWSFPGPNPPQHTAWVIMKHTGAFCSTRAVSAYRTETWHHRVQLRTGLDPNLLLLYWHTSAASSFAFSTYWPDYKGWMELIASHGTITAVATSCLQEAVLLSKVMCGP